MKRKNTKRGAQSNGANAATRMADEFLRPIIEGTQGYGDKKRLLQAMEKRSGEPISRTTLERWLNKDESKRQQPFLGSGLLLRKVFDEQQKHN